jgi:hypothetical protein
MSTREIEHKSFTMEVKDAASGEVVARVATINTVDRDQDVFLPGSIGAGHRVKLSSYGHDTILGNAPPAGIGTITEEKGEAILRGRFFMSTQRGQEAFMTVRELGEDGEWSVGFPRSMVKLAPMTKEWHEQGARRLIAGVTLIEVSPVMMGAQIGTGTLYTKCATDPVPLDAMNAHAEKLFERRRRPR